MPSDACNQPLYVGQTVEVIYTHSHYVGLRATIASFRWDESMEPAQLNFIPPQLGLISLYCWKLRGLDPHLVLDGGL